MTGIDPELLNDEFWESAFEENDPFRGELKTEFRRGVITGNEDDLRWGRMAMASITDDALWPLLSRLIQLAVEVPGAEFVESLVFFLSDKSTHHRLLHGATNLPSAERARYLDNLTHTLGQAFVARHELDLVEDLEPFRAVVRGIAEGDRKTP